LIVVLLSRQRTATVAIFAGLGILLLLDSDLLGRNRMLRRILAVTLFCIVLLVVTLVASGEMLAILPESFRDSLLKRDTWYGRMEIWEGALYTYNSWGLSSRAFGRPAGESLNIVLYNNTEWIYSVHNAYIGFLIDYGFVGAGLWVTLLLAALVAAFRTRKMLPVFSYDLHPSVAASWLTMLLIFGFSYEWRDALAVFLGLALIPLIRRKDTQFVLPHGSQAPRRFSG
jgi:O-antigen ligase